MKLKKYYAENMQDALKIIKEEIGPDAVILSSKFVRTKRGLFGLFSKKQIEVVAGYEEKPKEKTASPLMDTAKFKPLVNMSMAAAEGQRAAAISSAAGMGAAVGMNTAAINAAAGVNPAVINAAAAGVTPASISSVASNMEKMVEKNIQEQSEKFKKIEKLDESIDELKGMISGLAGKMESYTQNVDANFSSEVRELYNRLLESDVERALATELCVKTEDIIASRDADPKEVLKSLILDLLGNAKTVQCTKFKRRVVMLIGPTGVGKTTTLIKLAAKFLYEEKLNIGVINADVFRVAAKEHLKAYCDILNTEMITIYRQNEITDALEAFKSKDIVFIDTAGKLSSNKQYQNEISELVRLGNVDDIYLLVSASTSERVLKTIVENYSFLKVHNLIVTKIDETPTRGMLLYAAKESGRPLSYITNGQNVPDDIVEIDPQQVADAVLGG